jgi:hypothetical protein
MTLSDKVVKMALDGNRLLIRLANGRGEDLKRINRCSVFS